MQVPLELSFDDLPPTEWIEGYIRERVDKLERICDDLIACRVTITCEHHHKHKGNPHRVRVELTMPPKKDLIGDKEGPVNDPHVQLRPIIRRAFEAVEKQLKKEMERRRGAVKHHEEPHAFVIRLFPERGYGFIKSPQDGREFFFHRSAVLHDDFDRMTPGTQVRFEEAVDEDALGINDLMEVGLEDDDLAELEDRGPQASTVQIIDKPGVRTDPRGDHAMEPPAGWSG